MEEKERDKKDLEKKEEELDKEEGKEELEKDSGDEEKPANEKEKKKQNKQLTNIFILAGFFIVVFLGTYIYFSSADYFEYNGVKFEIVDELAPYRTSIPLYQGAPITGNFIGDYNFYLRKDPRKIGENVEFKGELYLLETVVLNTTENFHCDGDGIIAIANLQKLLQTMGAEVMTDVNAVCDWQGKYNFIQLQSGNKTEIRLTGLGCYELTINDCEILEVTERFMLEVLSKVSEAEQEE